MIERHNTVLSWSWRSVGLIFIHSCKQQFVKLSTISIGENNFMILIHVTVSCEMSQELRTHHNDNRFFLQLGTFHWVLCSPRRTDHIAYQTHWGRVTHICVSKLTIIGSDNGLSLDRRQAIIWTNTGLLLIGPLGTNFSEILIKILTFSFKKMRLKVSSAKRRPFCLGLNVLTRTDPDMDWYCWLLS